jgi:MscS family membrane protein
MNFITVYETGGSLVSGFAQSLPSPFNTTYALFIINILLWLVIAVILYFFIKYIVHGLVRRTKTDLDDAIVSIVRKPILILVVIYGVITSVIDLGLQAPIQMGVQEIFSFIVLGIGLYVAYRIYIEVIEEFAVRRGGETFHRILRPLFRIIGIVAISLIGVFYALTIFGINITALLAGAGVLGLVLAFAAQETLSNFFSGLYLLVDRPFQIGDIILLENDEYCRVEGVGMRSTKLYSIFDHELIIVPNNTIANQKIVNIMKPDTKIRQRVEVGVAYGSDVALVKKILYDTAAGHPHVLTDDQYKPLVRFTDFGESSLNFLVIFTVDDVMNQWTVKSDIITELERRFRDANVTIPFPQRTLWIHDLEREEKKKR